MKKHRLTLSLCVGLALAAGAFFLSGGAGPVVGGDPPPCSFPDGFAAAGNCCELTGASLPAAFPSVEQEIRYIVWRRCALTRNKTLCVDIGAPQLKTYEGQTIGCGTYTIPFTMRTCGAQEIPIFTGELNATHVRTYVEEDFFKLEPDRQVWRFLINGDLEPSAFLVDRYGTNPNIPQCFTEFGDRIHWFGYIEYRRECDSGRQWSAEWVLDHECDRYHHGADSARPGAFHPDRSFNFAGPSNFEPTTAYNLISGNMDPGSEGVRQIRFPDAGSFASCDRFDTITGVRETEADSCSCSTQGEQYGETGFTISSSCGDLVVSAGGDQTTTRKRIGGFKNSDDQIFRFVDLFVGDILWLNNCETTFEPQFAEGVEIVNPFYRNRKFDASGNLVTINNVFLDFVTSNEFPSGTVVKGAPHLSRLVGATN